MLTIRGRVLIDDVIRRFEGFEKQLPFAMARALTKTAQDVQAAERQEMKDVLHNPTPYTLRALYLKRATKQSLRAEVWLKDDYGTKAHYLMPLIRGGARPLKRFEAMLRAIGYMRADERAVPAAGAQMDAYGNMNRGQLTKILSQLRAHTLSGYDANATNSKRSRAKRAQVEYFVSGGPGTKRTTPGSRRHGPGQAQQHLPRGVWMRRRFAIGSSVKPVLLFVDHASYTRRFDFYGVAERTIAKRFPHHMNESADIALRTAFDSASAGGA